jgi:guanylate kinase
VNKVVITLTGPSCSGKTTIEAELTRRGMHRTISTTSRAPRAGEFDGIAYHFVTRPLFERMWKEGELVEYVQYENNYYGLSRAEFEKGFDAGKAVIAVVEPSGRNQIARYCAINGWKHVSTFIDSNADVMLRRLASRTCADLQEINLDNDPLERPTKVYNTLARRLDTMREVEFEWMREARQRRFPYTAYIRVSNESNFDMIIRFLEAVVAAHQEPGVLIGQENLPVGLGDAAMFAPWMRAA